MTITDKERIISLENSLNRALEEVESKITVEEANIITRPWEENIESIIERFKVLRRMLDKIHVKSEIVQQRSNRS